jgi:hypothetical protein
MTPTWSWLVLIGLGAFHGLNPAMGWLFAVALGLQRRARSAVWWSLIPIAIGHAIAVGLVVILIGLLRLFVAIRPMQIAAAAVLIAFGIYRLLARHRAWVGMQVGGRDLALWSLLMATAHGAGLMLLPVLLQMPLGTEAHRHAHLAALTGIGSSVLIGSLAVAVHTIAMLLTAGVIAGVVYEWVGLAFLRKGWINLDLLWVLALIGAGIALLAMALLT